MGSTSRTARRLAAVVLAGLAGGCGYHQDGVQLATLGNEIPVTQAFMVPPPGGPQPIAVLEQRYRNAYAQDIVLENTSAAPGQNVLLVRAFGPMGRTAGRERLERDVPTITDIRREMRERFPGIHMEVSGLYAQNRYGPFTYATGRAAGANCLYAVQRIAAEERVFAAQRGAIVWRLRVCDRNTAPRDLLLLAYGLTINGYFLDPRWNPYGDPPEFDPRVGTPGETVLPEQRVDPTVVAPVAYGQTTRGTIAAPRRRRARRSSSSTPTASTQPAPTVLNQPIEGAAVVPRPENTDLSEPNIEDSNLPSTAPSRPGGAISVPTPSSSLLSPSAPRPTSGVPLPPPAGTVIAPTPVSATPGVRVIER